MQKDRLTIRDKLIIVLVNIIFIVSVNLGNYLLLGLFAVLSLSVMVIFKPDYGRLPKRVALVFLYPLFVSVFIPFVHEGIVLARPAVASVSPGGIRHDNPISLHRPFSSCTVAYEGTDVPDHDRGGDLSRQAPHEVDR